MKRYALVGTGARAGMFITALTQTYQDACELVGLCDVSSVRMRWYQRQLEEAGSVPPPLYPAKDFDRMVRETKPDVVIVTTVDAYHHLYISRAMELGCDVITEKPLTIDADKLRVVFDAVEQTGRSLRVAFNYRYAPAYSRLRALLKQGTIGKPLNIDFSWLLDRSHGADYFRRWHSEKVKSGGLLVHKATHHFDLVNWWLGDYPKEVFALGDLLFYGRGNATARGERYSYERYTGAAAERDPFALYLDKDERMRELYLDAEAESGYLRDRNVFGDHISIEDTMTVTARYRGGALLSYCLLAYAPWEGLRVALTGTEGRANSKSWKMSPGSPRTPKRCRLVRARSKRSPCTFFQLGPKLTRLRFLKLRVSTEEPTRLCSSNCFHHHPKVTLSTAPLLMSTGQRQFCSALPLTFRWRARSLCNLTTSSYSVKALTHIVSYPKRTPEWRRLKAEISSLT